VLREVGQNGKKSAKIIQQAIFITACSSVMASGLAAALGTIPEADALVRKTVLVFSVALLMRSFSLLTELIFIAHEQPRILFPVSMIIRPVEAISGIIALLMGKGLVELAAIHAISWALQAGVLFTLAARRGLVPRLGMVDRSG
jgi:hypothetical protein